MSHSPRILAIIPARAGSKGVPGKNMRVLGKKPLIQHTFEAALDSGLLDTIIVSTDCPEVMRFANKFRRISAPFFRPPELATDDAPMGGVAAHALAYAERARGPYELVVVLQPTCPFRPPGLIDEAVRHMIAVGADSLVTVRKIPDAFNPYWAYEMNGDWLTKAVHDVNQRIIPCRQQLPAAYHRDGALYIARASLVRGGQLMGGKIAPWINESDHWVNIDTMDDWLTAEKILNKWKDHTPNTCSC